MEKTLTKAEMIDFFERNDWGTYDNDKESEDFFLDFGNTSPAGEDFSLYLCCKRDVRSIYRALFDICLNFDVNEHVYQWLREKIEHEVDSIPDVDVLVDDAKAIQDMLEDLVADFRTEYLR